MDFDVELTDGNCAVIRARGRLNLVSAPAVRDLVARVVREDGRSHVVVDLAETVFMDSSGLVDPDCLRKVHSLLAAMWATSTDVSELDRMMFETAVMEIAANIVQHTPDKDPTK